MRNMKGLGMALAMSAGCCLATTAFASNGDNAGVTALTGSKPTFVVNPAAAAGHVMAPKSSNEFTPRGGPVNDECTDVTPEALSIGGSVTFTGDSTGASGESCGALGAEAVWHAVTTDATGTLTVDWCGTDPNFSTIYIVIDDACPCDGSFLFFTSYEFFSCNDDTDGDGFSNGTVTYNNVPAGTWYVPVFYDGGVNSGPYTMTVSLAEGGGEGEGEGEGEGPPPPGCPGEGGDCCTPDGTPGCDDLDCCEAICAADPFCCDTSWDQLCADAAEANDLCDEGTCEPPPPPTCDEWVCDGDANGDGIVDPLDTGYILARFGLDPCVEGCAADVNCDGVIDPLDSGYALARFNTCDEPPVCEIDCTLFGALTDHCADAEIVSLSPGSEIVYTGNNVGADMECAAGGFPELWAAITTTETINLTASLCGTVPAFGNAYIVIDDSCPCDGSWIFSTGFENTCDGNWVVHYDGLAPGTYWVPMLSGAGSEGDFTWTLSAD